MRAAAPVCSSAAYGVLSYSVVQRTREIGIRVALGASSRDVVRLVLAEGLALLAVGVVLGLGSSLLLTRLLKSLLFEVQPTHPAMLFSVTAILVFVALNATLIPAARAFRVDPMIALHYE